MTHEHAGGQNTQLQLSPWIGSLTADLAAAAGEIAALFADARAVSAERDEFGHARSRFCADAVALMKASAKVGQTIAQLQGSKFEHNINVRRDPPISKDSSSEDEEEDEDEEGSATLMWLNPDTLWDWRKSEPTCWIRPGMPVASRVERLGQRGTPSQILEVRMGTPGTLALGRWRLQRHLGRGCGASECGRAPNRFRCSLGCGTSRLHGGVAPSGAIRTD